MDMSNSDVWEPVAVKLQVFKTAIESACMLLRIDDVVSGKFFLLKFIIFIFN